MFLEAISELQREFDLVLADERSVETARLLMDLCLLRCTLLLFLRCSFSQSVVPVYQACPARSGEVRQIEFLSIGEINERKGRSTVSKWVLDSRRNVLTRRPLKCFELFIGNR